MFDLARSFSNPCIRAIALPHQTVHAWNSVLHALVNWAVVVAGVAFGRVALALRSSFVPRHPL